MNKKTAFIFAKCMSVALVFLFSISNAQSNLIPKPQQCVLGKGKFVFNNEVSVAVNGNISDKVLQNFATELEANCGKKVKTGANNPATITINITTDQLQQKSSYSLSVKEKSIVLNAADEAGAFYGFQSIIQLIETQNKISVIPVLEIKDSPRFDWRGMHLDVSRHFFPVSYIKRYIDAMAKLKLNIFHWHLTDDQGWRIEIKKYPLLTEKGAWRKDREDQAWTYFQTEPEEGGKKYGGFYTQEEIKEVIRYAQERQITIVPEIDMPGHMWAAIYAYNYLSCEGKVWRKPENVPFEFADPICICNPEVVNFCKDVLGEVADLFPSEYVHIGGDESKTKAWENIPSCQAIMKTENINLHGLQSRFNRELEEFLKTKNKRMIGWEEILEGGVTQSSTIMNWLGVEGAVNAAKKGNDFVNASSSDLYFDMAMQEEEIGSKWYRSIDLKMIYNFNPLPKELTAEETKHCLGSEGCMWTEQTKNIQELEERVFPRLFALAEMTWTNTENKNYENFLKRLPVYQEKFEKLGYYFYKFQPMGVEKEEVFINPKTVKLYSPQTNAKIKYTLDGSEPTAQSQTYAQPIIVSKNLTIKAKAFFSDGSSSLASTGKYTKGSFQNALVKVPALVQGLNYEYAENISNSFNELDQAKVLRKGNIPTFKLLDNVIDEYWGCVYTGYIKIPKDDIYSFYLTSDDGSGLYINDKLVVDNDGGHGKKMVKAILPLKAGYHKIKLKYFDGKYSEFLNVEWSAKDMPKQEIKSEYLYRIK